MKNSDALAMKREEQDGQEPDPELWAEK